MGSTAALLAPAQGETGLRRVRVVRLAREALEVCSVELAADDAALLPPFAAGAHVDVRMPSGVVRQYSLCNDPADRTRYQLAVLKEPASRGGSDTMHALAVDDVLQISEPRNHFALDPRAESSLLLAGGIGITPLLAMAHTLSREGAIFALHYCARSEVRAAFVERLRAAAFADRVYFHFDDGAESQRFRADGLIARPPPGEHLYVCGPGGFIDIVLATARAAGWPETSLHFERFQADPLALARRDAAFEVEIASSGVVVPVAAHETIASALAARGIDLPTSCEQGVCGTCVVKCLAGTPDHRDSFLTDAEHADSQMTPCCSRAKSARLVLDM